MHRVLAHGLYRPARAAAMLNMPEHELREAIVRYKLPVMRIDGVVTGLRGAGLVWLARRLNPEQPLVRRSGPSSAPPRRGPAQFGFRGMREQWQQSVAARHAGPTNFQT